MFKLTCLISYVESFLYSVITHINWFARTDVLKTFEQENCKKHKLVPFKQDVEYSNGFLKKYC